MPTTLSFTTFAPRGTYPMGRDSSNLYWDQYHDWGTYVPSISEMNETATVRELKIGGPFENWPGNHSSYMKKWVSPPLAYSATISDNFLLVGDFRQTPPTVLTFPPDTTLSSNMYPGVFLYVYRPSTNMNVGTIVDARLGTQWDYSNRTLQTWTITPDDAVVASAGDRLVIELYAMHSASTYLGYTTEEMIMGTGRGLVFPSLDMVFLHGITSSDKLKYNIRRGMRTRFHTAYDVALTPLTSSVGLRYWVSGVDVAYWYFDDISPGRGRYSLVIDPRVENKDESFFNYMYSEKWVFDEPSVHKYFMIDDFEHYDSVHDLHNTWNIEDTVYSYAAIKTYSSAQDISDFNMLSFVAKASNPTKLAFVFEDTLGSQSYPLDFILSKRTERYEGTISWQSMNRASFSKILISSSDSGHTTVDDVLLLNCETDSENISWMKLAVTALEETARVKYSSFKIPFRNNELLQMGGDDVSEGRISFKSNDSMQISFMDEMLRTRTPLYLRFKNYGIPFVLEDYSNKYKNMIRGRNSSDVKFNWTEIYDDDMF